MYLCMVSVNHQPHVIWPADTAAAAFGALGVSIRHALDMEDVLALAVAVVEDGPDDWHSYRDATGRDAMALFDEWLAEQGEALWLTWRMKTQAAVVGYAGRD